MSIRDVHKVMLVLAITPNLGHVLF